jgi:hypothetical protein
MRGVKINSTTLNSRVKLVFSGHDLILQPIEYDIEKNTLTGSSHIRTDSIPAQALSQGFASWRVNDSGKYFFKARVNGARTTNWFSTENNADVNYRYLDVSDTGINSPPVAKIDTPKTGEIYNKIDIINFNQSSYDIDDYMNYSWNFGDGTPLAKGWTGYPFDYNNYNTTHVYNAEGQKNILLSVIDERRATAEDFVSILAINPADVGKKYVFANISKPGWEEVTGTSQEFDAAGSFAIEITATGIICIAGACPSQTMGGIPITPPSIPSDYSRLNFTWKFDDGTSEITKKGEKTYTKYFGSDGWKTINLTVTLDSGEKSSTYVKILVTGTPTGLGCDSSGYWWWENDNGIIKRFSTLEPNNNCTKGIMPPTSDYCCPSGGYLCTLNTTYNKYQCQLNLLIMEYCNTISSCSDYNQAN